MTIKYYTKVDIAGTLNPTEEKILNKYWQVDFSKKPYKFQFSVSQHKQNSDVDSKQITQILRHGKATCTHPSFSCASCLNNFYTNSRKEFLSQFKKTTWLCQSCETQKIYDELKPYIDSLETWDNKRNQNTSKQRFNLNDLKFIELLALYIQLKDISPEKLSSKSARFIQGLNLTGNQQLDEKILDQLIEKNIFKKIDINDTHENSDYQKILRAYSCSVYKPKEIRDIIKKFDKKFHFCKPNSYLVLPDSGLTNHFETFIDITKKLNNYRMDINDLEDLQVCIDEILLFKAFKFLELVQRNYCFPIKKSIKIERLLKKAMDLLTPEQAYGWINSVGKKTAETIDNNRKLNYLHFNTYQENYIFLNRLESYLHLIEKEERKSFFKILPEELYATSALEQYLSEIISEIGVSFISMNGRDIKQCLVEYYL